MEQDPRRAIEALMSLPLLQHGELRRVPPIPDPESISTDTLRLWLDVSRELCNEKGFQCLAFNEMNEGLRSAMGFNTRTLPPRVVFFREEMGDPGVIIMNPRLRTLDNYPLYVVEACGSIEYGQVGIVIRRYLKETLFGLTYDGTNDVCVRRFTPKKYRSLVVHELEHLNGKTALDSKFFFFDPEHNIDAFFRTYSNHNENALLADLAERYPAGLVGYSFSLGEMIYLDPSNRLAFNGIYKYRG